jgi:acyl-[acyl-carrier-protein] desaturase
MANLPTDSNPEMEKEFYRLYRDFFEMAERKRRWSLPNDIPWDQCNKKLNPVIADVVESFCAVELYLPDYMGKLVPLSRASRGRSWFYFNWGYEESKHSLALGDWLLRSGMRTEEQMADMENMVFEREWNLPRDNSVGMFAYAMVQELATWLNYRNLRRSAIEFGGDPALEQLLMFVQVDERAHHTFFLDCVKLFLKHDREGTLEQLRAVMNAFHMPAIHELADTSQRVARIKELQIFDEDIYFRDVYQPVLTAAGVTWAEMRNRKPKQRKSQVVAAST